MSRRRRAVKREIHPDAKFGSRLVGRLMNIVMQRGKIVEQGKHQELLALNGTYKKLVDMQSFE